MLFFQTSTFNLINLFFVILCSIMWLGYLSSPSMADSFHWHLLCTSIISSSAVISKFHLSLLFTYWTFSFHYPNHSSKSSLSVQIFQELELYIKFLNKLQRYYTLNKTRNIYIICKDKNNLKFVSIPKNILV